jgi:paraquat-inducible protein A
VTIACPDCGLLQDIPALPPQSTAACRLCEADLEKTTGRSISAALACSTGTFLLLFPVNLLPLIRIDIFGMHATNVISGGIAGLFQHGWAFLPAVSAVLVVGLPFVRFGLLTTVLAFVQFDLKARWLGAAFRWADWLDPWAMLDVYLLAAFVGTYRLMNINQAHVSVEPGGYCFLAAAVLTMLSRAALDRRTVWRAISPECHVQSGERTLSCTTCDIVQPLSEAERPCPRCGATLHTRKPDAVIRTAALLLAAFVLFFPANFFPMNVSNQSYTIFTGIEELFDNGLWPLGIVILCTSILIPFGKIMAIGWCVWSVVRGSRRHLVFKTKLFRAVAELGRWSNTDPFIIVFFVPLMNFGALASATAGWGATAFMLMTLLTMIASYTFDPRLMWDAAQP